MKNKIMNNRGMSIISSIVVSSIIAVVVVGLGQVYFSSGRIKSNTDAKISFVDYENAAMEAIGKNAFRILKNCDYPSLSSLNVSLGKLGSVIAMNSDTKAMVNRALSFSSSNPDDTTLKGILDQCQDFTPLTGGSSPGAFFGCVVFKDPNGAFSFMNMLGVFATIKIELGERGKGSESRLLASPVDCNVFKNSANPEIRLIYQIYFKKFNGSGSVFSKAGVRFVSE